MLPIGSLPSLKPTDWKTPYTDHAQARVSVEVRPGGQILRYQGPMYNSFFWYSGDTHVEVFFYTPIPQQEQFVAFYLKKFPSTLRNQQSNPSDEWPTLVSGVRGHL